MRKIILFAIVLLSIQIAVGQNSSSEEKIFEEFKSLYNELLEFKGSDDFKKYGFAIGGPYNYWLKKIQTLKNDPNSKLLLRRGFVAGELETLGLSYVASKGRETDVTIFFNKIFSEAIKSSPK